MPGTLLEAPRTFAEVSAHLPACLTGLVRGYFDTPPDHVRTYVDVGKAGLWEECFSSSLPEWRECILVGATFAGHCTMVDNILSDGVYTSQRSFGIACGSGNMGMVSIYLDNLGDHHNQWSMRSAMASAAHGGHYDIVVLLADSGADNWNGVLREGCRNKDARMIKLAADSGATCCNYCDHSVISHRP